jgi:Ala-tRNA(Pro) deacylase
MLESYLRENQVSYETQSHARAFTAQEIAAAERIPGRMLAKVVMVMADERLAMLVLPAPYQVDLDKARALLAAKEVRLAEEREFGAAFPDCEVGAMPPFGNLYKVPAYVDRTLADDETIVFNAGTHTETMSLKYADFERLAQPTIGDFSRRELAERSATA